jgi:uncharacterized membrane protein
MSSKDVHFLFVLRNQIKLYHWQTRSYARHVATDNVLKELDELIDQYVEVYMGKYGRPKLSGPDAIVRLQNLSEAGATKLIRTAVNYFMGPFVKHLDQSKDTDLLNLRDEMVGHLHQLAYLFTLK